MLLTHSNIWHLFDCLKEEVVARGGDRWKEEQKQK